MRVVSFGNKYVVVSLIDKLLFLALLTFVPIFELRWSIPIGLFSSTIDVPFIGSMTGFGLPWLIVFIVCVGANALLGLIAYFFFDKIIHFFLRINFLKRFYDKIVVRAQRKSKSLIENYGFIGLALFIAVPLPGSGTWTGALVGHLLGFGYKKFFLANLIGVIIAGILVTAVSLGLFSFLGF